MDTRDNEREFFFRCVPVEVVRSTMAWIRAPKKTRGIADQFAVSFTKLELNKLMLLGALFETDF